MTVIEGAAVTSEVADIRIDPLRHRESVVRRLLELGISPVTLRTILPDFRTLVDRHASRG